MGGEIWLDLQSSLTWARLISRGYGHSDQEACGTETVRRKTQKGKSERGEDGQKENRIRPDPENLPPKALVDFLWLLVLL
jgi:hypothetical protein